MPTTNLTPDPEPTVVARVTVACPAPSGKLAHHRIDIYADGHATAPGHRAAPWGDDAAVVAALGGPPDYSPCAWWQSIHPQMGAPSWSAGLVTWPGLHQQPRSPTLDVLAWPLQAVADWTEDAKRTALVGFGVIPTAMEDRPLPDPAAIIEFLRAFRAQLVAGEQVYAHPLAEAIAHIPPGEAPAWADAGVPHTSIYLLRHAGADRPVAAAICAAHRRRAAQSTKPASLGTPGTWADTLASLGMQIDRIAAFTDRTAECGQLYPRVNLIESIAAEVRHAGIPRTWIVEAVCGLPERDLLNARAGEHLPHDWGNWWASEVAAPRITRLLLDLGDPSGWPAGWCWPTGT